MTRTPSQIAAIEASARTVCVDASAGSGKTSVLIDRIIHLIERRAATLDEIVAITFTDKAAAEMKVRLRKAFRDKAPADDPDEMSRWRGMERSVETARISTIHAFCAGLLREHALRIGLDPDFTVLADAEALLLLHETVVDAVHGLLEQGHEGTVRAATEFGTQGLITVLTGLLGKRGLMDRVRRAHPVGEPEELAGHWRGLVEEARRAKLLDAERDPELLRMRDALSALDAQCSKANDGREVARVEMMRLLDRIRSCGDPEAISELLEAIAALRFTGTSPKNWESEEALEKLKSLQDELRKRAVEYRSKPVDEAVETQSARLTCDVVAAFDQVEAAHQRAKAARIGLDFDDLIHHVLTMLRDSEEVRARTARGIKFLLIDEFQDTDAGQLEIARLIAGHAGGPALFIVGDAKQSIYDFRGAEVEVFQQEKASAAEKIPLTLNFRTVPDVMAFVNEVFRGSGLLRAVEPDYVPLETHRGRAGESRIEFLIPAVKAEALKNDYRSEEADLIASRLGAMCRGPNRVCVGGSDDAPRPAEFGDVAMLFRSLTSLYLYEEALRKHEIPYRVVAGAGFYERQEVVDLHNLLTVLVDPWDAMALVGFLRGPLGGLSDESLLRLCRHAPLVPSFLSDFAPEGLGQGGRLNAARALIADLRAHMELPVPAFLRYLLDRTGYEAIALSQFLGMQKAWNVRKIVDLADDFARTRPAKLAAFENYLDAIAGHEEIREGDAALQPEGAGTVTVMTIHKAKGLEFPIVAVPDLSRGRRGPDAGEVVVHRTLGIAARVTDPDGETARPAVYEAIRDAAAAKDADEHARILYVAMTRARDWLILSGAPDASKGSWLKTFDDMFQVARRADGERFAGTGWSAVVRRNVADTASPPVQASPEIRVDAAGLARRAEPVAATACGRRTFSVSELLDAMADASEEQETAYPCAGSGLDALLRGTIVHRLFERWDFRSPPPVAALLAAEYPALKTRAAMASYLSEVTQRFRASALGRRLAREAGAEKEVAFLLRVADAVVSGTMDAVLEDATIIDYKTGRYNAAMHAHYECQLRLYAAAVQRLRRLQPPAAVLYYVDTGEEHLVDVRAERVAETLEQAEIALRGLMGH